MFSRDVDGKILFHSSMIQGNRDGLFIF